MMVLPINFQFALKFTQKLRTILSIMAKLIHYPVMLQNVLKAIASLNTHRIITVADCNFGLGGHSNAILKQFPNCRM